MSPALLIVAVLLIMADAFFVSVEFALLAARRSALEPLAEAGDRGASRALTAMSDLNRQLSGAQLGITMSAVGLGFVGEPVVAHLLEEAMHDLFDPPEQVLHTTGFVLALTIIAFFHMLLGEVVPKNLAIARAERTATRLAGAHRVFVAVFSPLISFLAWLAARMARALGVEPKDELGTAHTPEELGSMLDASHGEGFIGEFEHSLLSGALDFRSRTIDTVMVPRDQVVMVAHTATVGEIEAVVVESGHSRLPVVGDSLDDLYGFVHAKDLIAASGAALDRPVPVHRIHRMLVLPADRSLEDALLAMRRSRVHVAAVRRVDPAEASARIEGIVTLEDLVEELVGEIHDETDIAPVDVGR